MNRPFLSAFLLAAGLSVLAGCGRSDDLGPTVPVTGRVTLEGKPLEVGTVTFVPDLSKGNKLTGVVSGRIDGGEYTLRTTTTKGERPGAPPGWYKVTVSTKVPPGADASKAAAVDHGPSVAARFSAPHSTPLLVEVKEGTPATQYELKLTSR